MDASSSVSFRRYCCSRCGAALRTPTFSLCISPLHFLRFPRDQDNLYLPTSSFLLGSETPLVQTASKQAGTAHTHESPCRRSYSSTPDGCAVHAVLILRVLLVPDVYTHVSTAVRVVSADLGIYIISRRHRAHAYVITGIHILRTT